MQFYWIKTKAGFLTYVKKPAFQMMRSYVIVGILHTAEPARSFLFAA